jgi:Iap family predicted aminopeptidase
MLVIHGGKDYRLGEAEGLATFTALQRRGVPSRMVFFPDENHWVTSPLNSLRWHVEVLGWLSRWCGAATTGTSANANATASSGALAVAGSAPMLAAPAAAAP